MEQPESVDISCGTAFLPVSREMSPLPAVIFGSGGGPERRSEGGDPVDLLTSTLLTLGFELVLSPFLSVPTLRSTPASAQFRLRLTDTAFEVETPASRDRRVLLLTAGLSAPWRDAATRQGWVLLLGGTGVTPPRVPGSSSFDLAGIREAQKVGWLTVGLAATSLCWARPDEAYSGRPSTG